MADTATASVSTAAKKNTKKASKPKSAPTHPKYAEMIVGAVAALKERGGSSRQAILKYIMDHYNVGKDESAVNTHLKMALKRGVTSGLLKQSKGTGASGSFKAGEKSAAKPKKPAKKSTKKSPKKLVKKTKSPAKKAKTTTKKKATTKKSSTSSKSKKSTSKSKKPKTTKAKVAKPKKAKSPAKKSKPVKAKK